MARQDWYAVVYSSPVDICEWNPCHPPPPTLEMIGLAEGMLEGMWLPYGERGAMVDTSLVSVGNSLCEGCPDGLGVRQSQQLHATLSQSTSISGDVSQIVLGIEPDIFVLEMFKSMI